MMHFACAMGGFHLVCLHSEFRPVARDFERGVLFDQKWTFTCMMINKGTETGCASGVWGHAPPENF